MTTLTHSIILFLVPYVSGIGIGVYIAWQVFDHRFYRPLRKNLKRALDGWQQTIDLSVKMAKAMKIEEPKITEDKDGLILSPLQVNFPWKRKRKNEDDDES